MRPRQISLITPRLTDIVIGNLAEQDNRPEEEEGTEEAQKVNF